MRVIISLCDYSGEWARPYAEAGYVVILVDPKHEVGADGSKWGTKNGMYTFAGTVSEALAHGDSDAWLYALAEQELFTETPIVHGVLMAPVCTHFTVSGAQYWPAKDLDGRTDEGLSLVDDCLAFVEFWNPEWWALENPIGRLPKLRPDDLGKYVMKFDPYEFAGLADDPERERYTKATCLWGRFNTDLRRDPLPPIRACSQGSWVQKLGGKSERTKELRSMTPTGFARAFFEANP